MYFKEGAETVKQAKTTGVDSKAVASRLMQKYLSAS
jgi:hypothetical protein